jgi:2-keto-4-pentenoate hydratase
MNFHPSLQMTPVSSYEPRSSFQPVQDHPLQPSSIAFDAIAEQFVAARQAGKAIAAFPGTVPETLADAYQIQDAAIGRVDEAIIGWKVGRIWPPLSDHFGAQRLSGPVFSSRAKRLNGGTEPMAGQVFCGGFGAAEAEFLLRISENLPLGKSDYSLAEAAGLIDQVHIGIEVASSPFAGINDGGPTVTIADFGNNNGLIIGDEVTASDYAQWDIVAAIDGVEVGRGTASAFPDGPVGSVRFLLNNLGERGIAVGAGTWVSTGAITGVHVIVPGQRFDAKFGAHLSASCVIEAVPTR